MTLTLLHAVVRTADARTPDPDLLARFAQNRDEAAFAELVRRHGPLVWAVCRQLLPHHADAEDAFQAVFLALVRGAAAVRAGRALPAWLHAAAVRTALKARRAAARRRRREEHAAVPEADRTVPDGAWANLMAAVHEEVRSLPDPERTAFVLCDLEGVRQPDAADRLGWPLGTLSGRLCKARQKLLDRLTRRGIAPAALAFTGSAGTVPAALAERVCSFPVAGAAGVSSAVAVLARGLTEGVAMRTKLAVGALMLAGAVGLGGGAMVLSDAGAQDPGRPAARPVPPVPPQPPVPAFFPPADAPGRPADPRGAGGQGRAGGWEYKFVDQRSADRDAFEKTLTQLGGEGWEYASSERFQKGNDTQTVLVFKRPRGGAPGFAPGAPGGGGGRPGGGAGGEGGVPTPRPPGGNTIPAPAQGGDRVPAARPAGQLNVIELKNAAAGETAELLKKLFPGSEFAADARTNSVVVRGDERTLEEVRALVTRLDAAGARKRP
ncbi:MAG: hypothetical protein C0501_04200 [Isosphaera sp.]|nr:hypothetical protein [Isosphaera sp.]